MVYHEVPHGLVPLPIYMLVWVPGELGSGAMMPVHIMIMLTAQPVAISPWTTTTACENLKAG
jgi:hypothetical protein